MNSDKKKISTENVNYSEKLKEGDSSTHICVVGIWGIENSNKFLIELIFSKIIVLIRNFSVSFADSSISPLKRLVSVSANRVTRSAHSS